MICPDCGAENRPGASFCIGCGTPLGTEETTQVDGPLGIATDVTSGVSNAGDTPALNSIKLAHP